MNQLFGQPNISHDSIKLSEGNIGKISSDINHSNVFLGQSHRAKEIQAKLNKWDLIKLRKSLCKAKENFFFLMKRQPVEWGKIFAKNVTDKGLISKICKQLIQLNIKKTNNSVNKQKGLPWWLVHW